MGERSAADIPDIFLGMADIPTFFGRGGGSGTRCWALAYVADKIL